VRGGDGQGELGSRATTPTREARTVGSRGGTFTQRAHKREQKRGRLLVCRRRREERRTGARWKHERRNKVEECASKESTTVL